jgi:predicted  nucleic acid-binding Zn-ribbon protein
MSRTSLLFQLQKIDSQKDQLLARLRVAEAELKDDSQIRAAEDKIQSLRNALLKETQLISQLEAQTEAISGKEKSDQGVLYGGQIRNPKELEKLELEMASLKSKQEQLEDQSLQAMMREESLRSDLLTAESELERLAGAKASREVDLRQEETGLSSSLAKLEQEAKSAAQQIPAIELETYQRLRRQKGGLAVALIEDKACTACGASLTQSEWEEASRKEGLVFCGACGRILSLG